MNEQQKRQLERERLLLRYMAALEGGELESAGEILREAEHDAVLEQMILEVNDVYAAEIKAQVEDAVFSQDAAVVRELVETHILPALSESEAEPPPLTVGNVIARIHADAALRGRVERDTLLATRSHQQVDLQLPEDLSLRGVSRLLEQLGVHVGRRFQNLFRETAIFMRMGRNQGMARLAATRMQQQACSRRDGQGLAATVKEGKVGYQAGFQAGEPSADELTDKPNDKPSDNAEGTDEASP